MPSVLANARMFLTEASFNKLSEIAGDLNLTSMLEQNGFIGDYDVRLKNIKAFDQKYKDDFINFLASNGEVFDNLKGSIYKAGIQLNNNNAESANTMVDQAFAEAYSTFAGSILSSNQKHGIIAWNVGEFKLGDYILGTATKKKKTSDKNNEIQSEKYLKNTLNGFISASKSSVNASIGSSSSLTAKSILSGKYGTLSQSAKENINSLYSIALNSDIYGEEDVAACAMAIVLIEQGYQLDFNMNDYADDTNYRTDFQRDVIGGYQYINGGKTDEYSGSFSTFVNSASIIAEKILSARDYKAYSADFNDSFMFEGFDNNGNIVTQNGSQIVITRDVGGDATGISLVLPDDSDVVLKTGITRIDNVSIHETIDIPKICKELGIKSSSEKYSTENVNEDVINRFNMEELILKGEDANFLVPEHVMYEIGNAKYSAGTVRYTMKTYDEAKEIVKGKYETFFISTLNGIFDGGY